MPQGYGFLRLSGLHEAEGDVYVSASQIRRCELRPGDALPSVRSLAEDLGINLHTVNKAYATLRDEGYVIMLGRRGAYVADAPADPAAGMGEAALEASLAKLATEFKASGGTREAFLAAAGRAARNLD